MSTKSTLIENNNKESVDKDKAKSFTGKIVNKISHMYDIRRNEIIVDKSSNVRFITFGLFNLCHISRGSSRYSDSICKCIFCSYCSVAQLD